MPLLLVLVLSWVVWRVGFRRRGTLDLTGRWVVVTGCDSGFGRGAVQRLLQRGASVIACCYTPEGAQAALDAGAHWAPVVDLSDEQAVVALGQDITERCQGRLWSVVHNAGVVLPGFVAYMPLSFYRRVMEVNFFAVVGLTRQLLVPLARAKGRVVVVSSVDGLVSLPGNAPYDASKFAVEAYADALRAELLRDGVHVAVVNPSTMRTPLALTFFEGHRKAYEASVAEGPQDGWQQAYTPAWLDAYVRKNTERLHQMAQDPKHAIGDITHAVSAKRPRHRYLSGTLSKTLFWALWVLPEGLTLPFKVGMVEPAPGALSDVSGDPS